MVLRICYNLRFLSFFESFVRQDLKKITLVFGMLFLFFVSLFAEARPRAPKQNVKEVAQESRFRSESPFRSPPLLARSWLLFDMTSGQILASNEAYKRIDPASLTELMTTYLIFSAIKEGKISLNQTIITSEQILKLNKGGLKMFIEPKTPVKVQDLVYGLVVQSGHDAAMTLVEAISESEEKFVEQMNREAQKMGLKSTHFSNPYGFSDKNNYSTAYDLSLLAARVIQEFPDLYKIYSIREFTYNRIRQRNRNRLLWLDQTVDGLKEGHTEHGGYNLIASAKRRNAVAERRLLSIVIGASSDQMRAQESLKLLNWGFENFDMIKLFERGQEIASWKVWKGSQDTLPVGFDFDAYASVPKGSIKRVKTIVERQEPILAPIAQNTRVGTLKLMLDDKVLSELPVIALEEVRVASLLGRMWDSFQLLFK